MRWISVAAIVVTLLTGSCRRAPEPRQYEVRGQILGVDRDRREVLVDHEDIKGFMPAMTMPYKVNDPALLDGKRRGDLVTATLVVGEVEAYLSSLNTTGHAPVRNPGAGPALTASDLVNEGDVVPDGALTDQSGVARPLSSLRGHRVVLTFMYTRCPLPDFCPLMDRHFGAIQSEVRKTPQLSDVRLVSVTLDPDFDTPAVLKKHAVAVGADPGIWFFATGAKDDVLAFAKRFGIATEPGETDAVVVHNLRTSVIDAEGRLTRVHSGNMWTPADIVADLETAPRQAR